MGAFCVLLSLATGVDYGWQPAPDGSLTYLIQVEPELLVQLDEGGIRPGASVSLERVGDYISVRVPGIEGALELPPEVAAHVFVAVK